MIRLAAAALVLLVGAVHKQAFEQKTPGVKVNDKQQTNQGVTFLRETWSRPEADVFRVSAVKIR